MGKPTQPLPEFLSLGRICRIKLLSPHLKRKKGKDYLQPILVIPLLVHLFIFFTFQRFCTAGRASGFSSRSSEVGLKLWCLKNLWTWVCNQLGAFGTKIISERRLLPLSLGWNFPTLLICALMIILRAGLQYFPTL